MSNTTLTEDRICTVLREKLYSMADNESQSFYEPLQLKWALPVESTQGMISLFENIIFLLDYVQKNGCNRDIVDQIIEYEIRPMVNGLDDVFDFFIASTILIISKSTDDFCNKDSLMKLVKDIIGDFLIILEMFVKQFDSEEYCTKDIDVSKLYIGMVIKNYKEMCKILGQEIREGNSKKAQLKEWERYFEWEKSGQKFIITDIYDTPLSREDKRQMGNNSVYVKYIELILMYYLSQQKDGTSTLTKRNWWQLLGMVNNKYSRISKNELKKVNSVITTFEINNFYLRSNKKLEQILFSALKNLVNRKLILEPEVQVMIVDNEKNVF